MSVDHFSRVILKLKARMTVRMPLATAETVGMSQTPFRPRMGVIR